MSFNSVINGYGRHTASEQLQDAPSPLAKMERGVAHILIQGGVMYNHNSIVPQTPPDKNTVVDVHWHLFISMRCEFCQSIFL